MGGSYAAFTRLSLAVNITGHLIHGRSSSPGPILFWRALGVESTALMSHHVSGYLALNNEERNRCPQAFIVTAPSPAKNGIRLGMFRHTGCGDSVGWLR